MKRKILTVLLILGLLAGAASVTAADDRVTVELWYGVGSLDAANTVFRMLAVDYPEIKMNTQAVPTRAIAEKMMLAIASDSLPNLIRDYNGRLTAWKFQGVTHPLLDTLTEEEKADFYPGMLESHTIDGDLFMYPQTYGAFVYLVNKSLLNDAGISLDILPTDDFTYKQWMEIAQKINDPPNVYAAVFNAKGRGGDYYMLDYFQMFGANLYEDKNYTQTTLNSEAGVRALEWMLEMQDKGFVPPGVAGISSADMANLVSKGKVLMSSSLVALTTRELWERTIEAGRADRVWDFTVVPKPHLESVPAPGIFIGSDGVSVFQEEDPKVLEAALKIAKTLLEPEYVNVMNAGAKNFSCRRSVKFEWVGKSEEHTKVAGWIDRFGVGEQGINSPFYVEIRNLRYPEFQAAFIGIKTPKQALDDFAKAVADLWK